MGKGRLEAFSDGVIAIIITIMVLEIKVPHGEGFEALKPIIPLFLSYMLSFIYVGIYWNNHHHMLHIATKVNGSVLWANMHLLFWLSLFPVVTGWAGESHLVAPPLAVYGIVLLLAAIAWVILQRALINVNGPHSLVAKTFSGKATLKEKISPALYIAGIAAAFWEPWVSIALYVITAVIWLIPDKRVERMLRNTA